jgi:hypothetical protein
MFFLILLRIILKKEFLIYLREVAKLITSIIFLAKRTTNRFRALLSARYRYLKLSRS